jgi:hypothetical protein
LFGFGAVVDSVAAISMNNALCLKESSPVEYSSQTVLVNDRCLIEEHSFISDTVLTFSRSKKSRWGQRLKFGALRPRVGSNDAELDETTT